VGESRKEIGKREDVKNRTRCCIEREAGEVPNERMGFGSDYVCPLAPAGTAIKKFGRQDVKKWMPEQARTEGRKPKKRPSMQGSETSHLKGVVLKRRNRHGKWVRVKGVKKNQVKLTVVAPRKENPKALRLSTRKKKTRKKKNRNEILRRRRR